MSWLKEGNITTFRTKQIFFEVSFYLGKIKDEYIVPTNSTNGDATKGIADSGSLLAAYDLSSSLFLNVRNIVVSLESSLKINVYLV